jgi:hypothetical protein
VSGVRDATADRDGLDSIEAPALAAGGLDGAPPLSGSSAFAASATVAACGELGGLCIAAGGGGASRGGGGSSGGGGGGFKTGGGFGGGGGGFKTGGKF